MILIHFDSICGIQQKRQYFVREDFLLFGASIVGFNKPQYEITFLARSAIMYKLDEEDNLSSWLLSLIDLPYP